MKRVVVCPVCCGNGLVGNGFYSSTRHEYGCLLWASGGTEPEECRSCKGKGWLLIKDGLSLSSLKYP